MIVSAISLWKKYHLNTLRDMNVWDVETKDGRVYMNLSYLGHTVADGRVRISARFAKPEGAGPFPAVLLLQDAGERADEELMAYFVDRGYAVLVPDYSGKMEGDDEDVLRTVYPKSVNYGNFEKAKGLYSLKGVEIGETSWVEWTYVALYSLKCLKAREDIGNIGVVGIRMGGDIAWQVMLSSDVKCGVPINSVGWRSFLHTSKFIPNTAHNMNDDIHRYIAGVEAQSYAPYVKCPVLMLCALRDKRFDCDRAYDTYSRIGTEYGNALVYSENCEACIGPNALTDMDLFLEKNLKDRQIYIPEVINVSIQEEGEELEITAECDKEGILEEAGIFYAEADFKTNSTYRDWRCIHQVQGRMVRDGKTFCRIKPFKGAPAVFAYAYAKYINGFRIMSKITAKKMSNPDLNAVKNRCLFAGTDVERFSVAEYKDNSIGGIFMEQEDLPKTAVGYGDIRGVYSVGGVRTYKISSPQYLPDEGALLKFDVYSRVSQVLRVEVEVADLEADMQRYTCEVEVKGGGKWKRIILKAADFKALDGRPLQSFCHGSALVFACAGEETEFSVTNILWL